MGKGNHQARGRRRTKTAAQHKRDGTYRKARHGNDDVALAAGSKTPPKFLNADAKREWQRICPRLVALGMFTVADRAIFSAYCTAYAEFEMLTTELSAMKSFTIYSKGVPIGTVPQVAARQKIWTMLKDAASRFGLDPVSRIGMDMASTSETDPDEEFLFGPRGVE